MHAGPASVYNQQSTGTIPLTGHVYKIKHRHSTAMGLPKQQSPLQRQIIRKTITNTVMKREVVKKTF